MALPVSNLRTILSDGTNEAAVNADGHLSTYSPSEVIAGNSSATPLTGGATFPGVAVNVLEFAVLQVNVYSDVVSATDGLSVQFSSDGTNWDHTDDYTIPATSGKVFSFQPAAQWMKVSGKVFSFQPAAQWMKVVYTNGAGAQSVFRLQTIGTHTNIKPSSHRISDPIIDDDDATLTTAVLKAKIDGDGYGNIEATESGNLKVANVEDGLAIAKGDVTGTTFIHKFGAAPDFDTGDGFVTVWDGAEDGEAWQLMNYIYSTTAAIDSVSSTDNGDTQEVEIQGLGDNYDLVVQTVTLTGQTRKALTTSLRRVFRIKNVNSVDFAGHVVAYENDTTTGGLPDDTDLLRAVVHAENNQTEMAVFTIPAGKTGYMRSWYASTAGAKRDSQHTIKVLARSFGGVFQLKHKANISVNGTSYIQHEYVEPQSFSEKTDIEIQMDTDQDAAGVAAGFDIVLIDN